MNKAKTNALDTLRALIAERQQYEQWMAALEAKREGTPDHVFERVQADYRGRMDKVVSDIRGHAEELQLSISTLSSRLVEVAREEDTRREGLQEAELRAAVGEYEPQQWEHLRSEAEEALGKIASDRASLDAQLGELRAIQKLSEVGGAGEVAEGSGARESGAAAEIRDPNGVENQALSSSNSVESKSPGSPSAPSASRPAPFAAPAAPSVKATEKPAQDQERLPLEPALAAAPVAATTTARPRSGKTPPGGVSTVRSRSEAAKPDQFKTLKCPECGTPNYPTEWYCERCGGELATM